MASRGGGLPGLRHLPALHQATSHWSSASRADRSLLPRAGRRIRTSEPSRALTSGMAWQLHGVETLAHA